MDESYVLGNYFKSMNRVLRKEPDRLIPVEYLVFGCDRNVYYKYIQSNKLKKEYNSIDELGRMYIYELINKSLSLVNGIRESKWELNKVEGTIPEYSDDGTLVLKYVYGSSRSKRNLPYPHHVKLASFYKYLLAYGKSKVGLNNVNIENIFIVYIFTDNLSSPVIKRVEEDQLLPEQLIRVEFEQRANIIWAYIQNAQIPPANFSWECGYCNYTNDCLNDKVVKND